MFIFTTTKQFEDSRTLSEAENQLQPIFSQKAWVALYICWNQYLQTGSQVTNLRINNLKR